MIFIIKVSEYKSKLKTFSLPKKLALGTSTDKETLKSKPISKFVLFNFYIKKSLLSMVQTIQTHLGQKFFYVQRVKMNYSIIQYKGQFQSTTFLSIVPFHSSLKTFLKNKFNSVHVQGRSFQRIEFKKEWILKWKNSYLHFLYLSSTNSIKL